MHKIIEMTVLP